MSERIAILGAGVMGGAMLDAFLASGESNVVVAEGRPERAEELSQRVEVAADASTAASGADIVVVAVKPQDVPALLAEISTSVGSGAIVVSLAAGVTIAQYEAALADGVVVFRVMPNTPVVVGRGVFGVSPSASASAQQLDRVRTLLESSGVVAVVDESLQNAVTAVSGSGPAYVFYLAEQMIAGGVEAGLDAETARALAVGTIRGAAELLEQGTDPAELRRQVTSPNGTTAAAIATFDESGVAAALRAGVGAAARRSGELSS